MPKKDKKEKSKAPSILSFNSTYMGCCELPDQYTPGLEAVQYALPVIKETSKDIETKVSLTISIYGIKAIRTAFAGIKQSQAMEMADGGVSFDFICNESIFRVAFCADVGKEFCYVMQGRNAKGRDVFRVYAFGCKSKKVAQQVADATALACQRVFNTLALMRAKIKSLEQVNAEVEEARKNASSSTPASSDGDKLVSLLHFEGYEDADAKFKAEMLEMAGFEGSQVPYVEPDVAGPTAPSKRTVIRQQDPNEYERTRF